MTVFFFHVKKNCEGIKYSKSICLYFNGCLTLHLPVWKKMGATIFFLMWSAERKAASLLLCLIIVDLMAIKRVH